MNTPRVSVADPQIDHDGAQPPISHGPAEVREVLSPRRVRLLMDGALVDGTLAAVGYDDPREGDRVLALRDGPRGAWVIGVLAPRPPSLLEEALEASATDASPVAVRDRRGRLLFEYDPERERAVLHVAAGDLELFVPEGALRMRARDGVTMESDADLTLRAGRSAVIEAARGEGPSARIAMQPGELTLVGSVLTAAADRAELLASKVGVKAHQVESHVDRVRTVAKVLDVSAGRIVERAKDVYREVERLSQTRAGRLKLVAKATMHLVGENTLVKARDRMKVKGERIHLA
jgi:hypothetical protein